MNKSTSDNLSFSLIIPARNEKERIAIVVKDIIEAFREHECHTFEIVIVDDYSTDATLDIAKSLSREYPSVLVLRNVYHPGFGNAVKAGLDRCSGSAIALVMADGSEYAVDIVRCFKKLKGEYDCIFGSRFSGADRTEGYPQLKKVMTRMGNALISILFNTRHGDITNGFKVYRRQVISIIRKDLQSEDFALSVELPLRALKEGFEPGSVPIRWRVRQGDKSKFKLMRTSLSYLKTLINLKFGR